MGIDYIIVSTSLCRYQKWQLELLNWSRKKVQQPGHLIILLSDDILHQELGEDITISFDDKDVTIYRLPDWARRWKLENDDWWGGIPNKYESTYWLCKEKIFSGNPTLLFVDPDMVFTKPIHMSLENNELKAQLWDGTQNPMYPFIINYNTLKKIAYDYKTECIHHRKTEDYWESEMFGFSNAVKKNNINVTLIEDLGRCTLWNLNDSPITSNLIHYPNEIYDRDGNKIFFKQDYTFDQTMKIEVQKARNLTDKILLNNVDQHRTDYLYWLKWDNNDFYCESTIGKNGMLSHKEWLGNLLYNRKDIFDKAWEFINVLNDKNYYAIDLTSNDIDKKEILTKSLRQIPINSNMYIAVIDGFDKELLKNIKNPYNIYFYSDILEKLSDNNIKSDWIPYIDQLICSRSKNFFGNNISKFYDYVTKLRGYMNDII